MSETLKTIYWQVREKINRFTYSRIHLTKDGGVWTLCGIISPAKSEPTVKDFEGDINDFIQIEKHHREKYDERLYCITCLNKALKTQQGA